MDFENGISGRKQMDGLMDSQLLTVGLQTNVSPARECKELSKKKKVVSTQYKFLNVE